MKYLDKLYVSDNRSSTRRFKRVVQPIIKDEIYKKTLVCAIKVNSEEQPRYKCETNKSNEFFTMHIPPVTDYTHHHIFDITDKKSKFKNRINLGMDYQDSYYKLGSFDGKPVTLENCIEFTNMGNTGSGNITYLLELNLKLQRGKMYHKIMTVNENILDNLGYSRLLISNNSDDYYFDPITGILSGHVMGENPIDISIVFKYNLGYKITIHPKELQRFI